jgi:hypothetical protein
MFLYFFTSFRLKNTPMKQSLYVTLFGDKLIFYAIWFSDIDISPFTIHFVHEGTHFVC